jgi:hypothetical protein
MQSLALCYVMDKSTLEKDALPVLRKDAETLLKMAEQVLR